MRGPGGPPPPPPPPMNGMNGFGGSLQHLSTQNLNGSNQNLSKANDQDGDQDKRKLIKLHWREATIIPTVTYAGPITNKEDSIWSSLGSVEIDKEKLAHLFELKQNEVKTKVNFLINILYLMPGVSRENETIWTLIFF